MTFSSRPKIVAIRAFQVLMPIFTVAIFTRTFPTLTMKILWLVALTVWEWFSYNIVEASINNHGLTYYRWFSARHISWNLINSVLLWKTAGGAVIVIEGRFLLRRYLFLLDSKPGIESIDRKAAPDDPIEIIRMRQKLKGLIS